MAKKLKKPSETKEDYVAFSFKYLDKSYCVSLCEDKEKLSLLEKMQKLSQLTWNTIYGSHKHGLGSEYIESHQIKGSIPSRFKKDKRFLSLRYFDKKPMVGAREGSVFHVIWVDRDYSLYNHGS